MKVIKLPIYDIVLNIDGNRGGIASSLCDVEREPNHGFCDCPDCLEELHEAAMNAIESLILAHAIGGVDVESPAYIKGIQTAVDAIYNHYGD